MYVFVDDFDIFVIAPECTCKVKIPYIFTACQLPCLYMGYLLVWVKNPQMYSDIIIAKIHKFLRIKILFFKLHDVVITKILHEALFIFTLLKHLQM